MHIPATIRRRWLDFFEYMIWKITERHVLYQLHKKQRRKSEGRGWVGKGHWQSGNFSDYLRKKYGVDRGEFKHELHIKEFSYSWYNKWFKLMYQRLRPVYSEYFLIDLEKTLDGLIAKGIVVVSERPEGIFIMPDAEKTRPILAWYYFPKIILEWTPAREMIGKFLKWLVILTLGLLGLSGIMS